MSKRVHQLEDALAVAHASSCLSPHPLLNAASSPDADGATPDGATDHVVDSDAEADRSTEKDNATILDSNILNAFGELAISDCRDTTACPGEAEVRSRVVLISLVLNECERNS